MNSCNFDDSIRLSSDPITPPKSLSAAATGYSIALNSDGTFMAVGASREYSSATGIGGNQADDSDPRAGAVYLY